MEHSNGINVKGRRFSANCMVGPGSNLTLSNKMQLGELPVEIGIFETIQMRAQFPNLPQGALGTFSFRDANPANAAFPATDAFLSGWFGLDARSFEDAWNQVRQGEYSECAIMLDIGPVESPAVGWLWDVAKNPHLFVDTVRVSFKRPVPTLGEPEDRKRKSFWRG